MLKGLTKKIALCTAFLIGISSASFAKEPMNLSILTSLEYKSNTRCDDGTVAIDNPVIDGFLSLTNGKWDIFAWGRYNTETENMNEVDFGAGYSFEPLKDLKVRLGIARWKYLETDGKNDVLTGSFFYGRLPVILGINATQVLDQRGTQVTGSVSKSFNVAEIKDMKMSLNPVVKGTYSKDFFGLNGYTNTIYGLGLAINKGNASVTVYVNQHDGKKGLDNDTLIGLNAGYSF